MRSLYLIIEKGRKWYFSRTSFFILVCILPSSSKITVCQRRLFILSFSDHKSSGCMVLRARTLHQKRCACHLISICIFVFKLPVVRALKLVGLSWLRVHIFTAALTHHQSTEKMGLPHDCWVHIFTAAPTHHQATLVGGLIMIFEFIFFEPHPPIAKAPK